MKLTSLPCVYALLFVIGISLIINYNNILTNIINNDNNNYYNDDYYNNDDGSIISISSNDNDNNIDNDGGGTSTSTSTSTKSGTTLIELLDNSNKSDDNKIKKRNNVDAQQRKNIYLYQQQLQQHNNNNNNDESPMKMKKKKAQQNHTTSTTTNTKYNKYYKGKGIGKSIRPCLNAIWKKKNSNNSSLEEETIKNKNNDFHDVWLASKHIMEQLTSNNNRTYWVSDGTLIGVLRYGGNTGCHYHNDNDININNNNDDVVGNINTTTTKTNTANTTCYKVDADIDFIILGRPIILPSSNKNNKNNNVIQQLSSVTVTALKNFFVGDRITILNEIETIINATTQNKDNPFYKASCKTTGSTMGVRCLLSKKKKRKYPEKFKFSVHISNPVYYIQQRVEDEDDNEATSGAVNLMGSSFINNNNDDNVTVTAAAGDDEKASTSTSSTTKTTYLFSSILDTGGKKLKNWNHTIPKETIFPLKEAAFYGETVPIPNQYLKVLEGWNGKEYGGYCDQVIPPKPKKTNNKKHNLTKHPKQYNPNRLRDDIRICSENLHQQGLASYWECFQ